jgi:hypothetical protein
MDPEEIGLIYEKLMSQHIFHQIPKEEISFETHLFIKIETKHRLPVKKLEEMGIWDPNLYKKKQLF